VNNLDIQMELDSIAAKMLESGKTTNEIRELFNKEGGRIATNIEEIAMISGDCVLAI